MLQAIFHLDPNAIRILTEQFNTMLDMVRPQHTDSKLEFVPGHPECAVIGEDNPVMRFIGTVAQFGSGGLVSVGLPVPKPEPTNTAGPVIAAESMEMELDPTDPTTLHVRLLEAPLPMEVWSQRIMYRDGVFDFERRAITPDHYYGAALYKRVE